MASALQLSTNGSSPQVTVTVSGVNPIIQPLGGFPQVDDLLEAFSEEVYDTGKDSHLFRFLQGLCGDTGAGQLKKQTYVSRLKFEASGLIFSDIDTFYSSFRFPRLSFEMPVNDLDVANSVLTKQEWDAIEKGDQSYLNRIKQFMQATRLGNSPDGMALAASAGSGVHCDIFESYKAHYSELHDDNTFSNGGYIIPYQGLIKGTSEFIINPHVGPNEGYTEAIGVSIGTDYPTAVITTTYTIGDILLPDTQPVVGDIHRYMVVATVSATSNDTSGGSFPTWASDGSQFTWGNLTMLDLGTGTHVDVQTASPSLNGLRLDPERERNMIHILDNLRPVGTLLTVAAQDLHYQVVPIASTTATTSNYRLTRFVTGKLTVDWPTPDEQKGFATENNPDRSKGYFIEAGIEKEQKNLPLTTVARPAIHHTIEGVNGYSDDALDDPTYGTADFKPSKYLSFHAGLFDTQISQIFPGLHGLTSDNEYRPFKAVAIQNTPLIFESNPKKG